MSHHFRGQQLACRTDVLIYQVGGYAFSQITDLATMTRSLTRPESRILVITDITRDVHFGVLVHVRVRPCLQICARVRVCRNQSISVRVRVGDSTVAHFGKGRDGRNFRWALASLNTLQGKQKGENRNLRYWRTCQSRLQFRQVRFRIRNET